MAPSYFADAVKSHFHRCRHPHFGLMIFIRDIALSAADGEAIRGMASFRPM